ncbi:hypothetical protein J4446_01690 [Candidatus Woesearchaeota archaeon]|nr:hypothetical protein [Candidatus Woesearchaeota archaeon]
MKIDEYLQKKQQMKDKEVQALDKVKELQETERKAKELRESLKAEKKRHLQNKMNNFTVLGMGFRPWTLNDMIIVLLMVGILVVGGISFIPGEEVSSDTNSDSQGFFSKLFGGFTVKSVDNAEEADIDVNTEDSSDTTDSSSQETSNEDASADSEQTENTNPVDFDFDIKYQDSPFTKINVTRINYLWYGLTIRNKESFNIKCTVNHYVNDELKDDKSAITLEGGGERLINMRELASDAVDTLSRVKVEITCSDGSDSSTENTQVQHLKFYFS